jgi:hypothetical protein
LRKSARDHITFILIHWSTKHTHNYTHTRAQTASSAFIDAFSPPATYFLLTWYSCFARQRPFITTTTSSYIYL